MNGPRQFLGIHCAPGECWVEVPGGDAIEFLAFLYQNRVFDVRRARPGEGNMVRFSFRNPDPVALRRVLNTWTADPLQLPRD